MPPASTADSIVRSVHTGIRAGVEGHMVMKARISEYFGNTLDSVTFIEQNWRSGGKAAQFESFTAPARRAW
jgi:hypothetical protein